MADLTMFPNECISFSAHMCLGLHVKGSVPLSVKKIKLLMVVTNPSKSIFQVLQYNPSPRFR